MKSNLAPKVVAITGGSGSGKSWLTTRLLEHFGARAARVSLDDFYRDRSHIAPARRLQINYDHPNSIDWELFETWLSACRGGLENQLPQYDFRTHTRLSQTAPYAPARLLLIEGLWLLRRLTVRPLIDLSIFIECPEEIRLERRIGRDLAERGRSMTAIRKQFRQFVSPMHERYVTPQSRWADMLLEHPIEQADVFRVAVRLEALLKPARTSPLMIDGKRYSEARRTCAI